MLRSITVTHGINWSQDISDFGVDSSVAIKKNFSTVGYRQSTFPPGDLEVDS